VAPLALVDFTAALSWRGIPYALRDRAALARGDRQRHGQGRGGRDRACPA